MAQLPLNLSDDEMQRRWKSQLDPVLANKVLQGQQLTAVDLAIGDNVINHKLGRTQLGWFLVDVDSATTIYRTQPFNDSTLTLNSSAEATINLWVY